MDDSGRLFESLLLPHLDDAYTLACWLTGSRHDAEDVVQDACLRALGAVSRQPLTNPRAWLLAIVRNTAATWLGRNRPRHLLLVDDPATMETAETTGGEDPEAAMIAAAERDELTRALAALPIAFREVLVLRDINGASYRDIAEIVGVPAGTVMSRIARGRALLMRQLAQPGEPRRDVP